MICNELYNGQGLGNQLWNYVLTRIIADKKNIEYSILGKEKFKGEEFIDIDFGQTLSCGFSPEGGPPHRLPKGIKNYYRERRENLLDTKIDISRTDYKLFDLPLNTKFDGNCQSTKYLEGYRDKILSWIKIKDNYKIQKLVENNCVIHIRCGDFKSIRDVFLPKEYYKMSMDYIRNINPEVKFYCVTDEKEEAEKILSGIEVIGSSIVNTHDNKRASHHKGGNIAIDFSILMNAKYLIIPNSSFSWWAAYLNTKKKLVIAPKYWAAYNKSDGYWSTEDIITNDFLYMDREGKIYTAKQCSEEKEEYESKHQEIFVEGDLDKRKIVSKSKIIKKKIKDFYYNKIRKYI